MKKFVLAIAMLSYLVVTCGVIFNHHYCMNRLASVNIYFSHDDQCGRCGMDIHQSNGCCRDEMTIVKMVDDQNKTLVDSYSLPSLQPAQPAYADLQIISAGSDLFKSHFHNHSPPLLSAQDIYLRNGVFRI
jgi:hypothetical protein